MRLRLENRESLAGESNNGRWCILDEHMNLPGGPAELVNVDTGSLRAILAGPARSYSRKAVSDDGRTIVVDTSKGLAVYCLPN